ncbi:MAG: hypothetical protein KAI33_04015, partial [Elusimicrobiales bacterium]|nr:hypothetical protein [Elusimicrobiales bacterium]
SLEYISGTSEDINSLGEIKEAQIRVKSQSNNNYWDWGDKNFTQAAAESAWFVVSTTEAVPYSKWFSTGTPPGSPNGINFIDGNTYEINARALDKADNYDLTYSTESFTYDIYKPTGTIEQLSGAVADTHQKAINPIAGSGFDGPSIGFSGLALIGDSGSMLRILEKETGNWWDSINGAFNISDGDTAWFKANTGTSESFEYSHADLNSELVNGNNYLIQYKGKDKSLPVNEGPSSDGTDSIFTVAKDSVSFIADKVAPVSRVSAPVDNSKMKAMSQISGTAQDILSGIDVKGQIEISIQEISPGNAYWTGVVPGTFTAASETFYSLDDATFNSSYDGLNWNFDSPELRDQYTYRIRVRARDNAAPGGNTEVDISSVAFTYDFKDPSAAITYPAPASKLKALALVSGTAYEDFEIKSASVSFQDIDSTFYYDPGTLDFDSGVPKWLTADIVGSGPNYTWSVTAPSLHDSSRYDIRVIAEDIAENVMPAPTATTITYDTTEPLSGVSTPASGDFLNNLVSVTGVSSDPNVHSSGVGGTQITIS